MLYEPKVPAHTLDWPLASFNSGCRFLGTLGCEGGLDLIIGPYSWQSSSSMLLGGLRAGFLTTTPLEPEMSTALCPLCCTDSPFCVLAIDSWLKSCPHARTDQRGSLLISHTLRCISSFNTCIVIAITWCSYPVSVIIAAIWACFGKLTDKLK